jgi:hypothetical protein
MWNSDSSQLLFEIQGNVKWILFRWLKNYAVITSLEQQSHFFIAAPKVAATGNYTLAHSLKKERFSPYITLRCYQSIWIRHKTRNSGKNNSPTSILYDKDRIENDSSKSSPIFTCVFVAAVKFLPSRCLATVGYKRTDTQTHGRDVRSTPLRFAQVLWCTYQVS